MRSILNFVHWIADIQTLQDPDEALWAQGRVLAEARRQALRELIQTDPERAVDLAGSQAHEWRDKVPPSVAAYFEETIEGYGTLNTMIVEGPATNSTKVVMINGRIYRVFPGTRRLGGNTFQGHIPIRGIAIDAHLAMTRFPAQLVTREEDLQHLEHGYHSIRCAGCGQDLTEPLPGAWARIGETLMPLCDASHLEMLNAAMAGDEGGVSGYSLGPSPAWTRGNKSLLYLPVQFADQGSPPTSRPAAEASLVQARSFFEAQSYGATVITGVVADPVLLAKTSVQYEQLGHGTLYNDAVAAAKLGGWDADLYDLVVIRHQGGPEGVGVALVGQKGAWLQSDEIGILCHELGHNFGLNHANGWQSLTSEPHGPGEALEYADGLDIMGSNQGICNAWEKSILHWLPDTVQIEVTQSGNYRLHSPPDGPANLGHIQALRLRKDIRDYWLEYRSGLGGPYGSDSPFLGYGLQIRWSPWSRSLQGTLLLDMTHGTQHRFEDAPLPVGHTFSDSQAGIHVTVLGLSPNPGEWIDLAIQLGEFPANHEPEAQLSASAVQVGVDQPVTFTVQATDTDGDPLAYGWDMMEFATTGMQPPWMISSNSPVQSQAWSLPGDYRVRCVVSDGKGGSVAKALVVRVGAPAGFAISGQVMDSQSMAMPGVLVFCVSNSLDPQTNPDFELDPSYRAAWTDDAGAYTLLNLLPGSYSVFAQSTISHAFFRSDPGGSVVVGPDASGIQFLGSLKPARSVRGIVRDGSTPVPGARICLGQEVTSSDAAGAFEFLNVIPGSYAITAMRGEDQYIALDNPVYVDTMDLESNIVARMLYQVSGEIQGWIGPVMVGTSEPGRQVPTFPGSGDFTKPWIYLLAVPRGLWNLEATTVGASFAPATFSNPVLVLGSEAPQWTPQGIQPTTLTNLHFQFAPGAGLAIRGRIDSSGVPIAGVQVQAGPFSATSDSLGNYALAGLPPGTYEIAPSLSGFTFSPSSSNVILTASSVDNLRFAGLLAPMEIWRTNQFTSIQRLDDRIGTDDADPDQDGVRNLWEYGLGLDPWQADSNGLPYATFEEGYLILNVTRPAAITDLEYMVEAAHQLPAPWDLEAIFLGETGLDPIHARWRFPQPAPQASQGFLRLKLQRQ